MIGVFTGYPIATAFTVTGAVVGVGLGLGGEPVWSAYVEILALWVLVPFVGGGVAYATARVLRSDRVPERHALPPLGLLVGLLIANVPVTLLGSGEGGESVAGAIAASLALPVSGSIGRLGVSLVLAAGLAGVLA